MSTDILSMSISEFFPCRLRCVVIHKKRVDDILLHTVLDCLASALNERPLCVLIQLLLGIDDLHISQSKDTCPPNEVIRQFLDTGTVYDQHANWLVRHAIGLPVCSSPHDSYNMWEMMHRLISSKQN